MVSAVLCLCEGVSVAQPGDVTGVDIRLVEAAPDILEVQLRPNASWSFTDGVVNLTFAIRWQTASGATINSDFIDQFFQGGPPFCMFTGVPLTGSTGAGIDNVDNGGFRYKSLNASGNQFPSACVFPANEWVPYARIPVAGISGCALFEVVADDPFANANNTNWFISLGGVEVTANSQVVGPGVELGSCSVDCAGVLGGSALPGTACDPGDPCITNAVYNEACECVGVAVPDVQITALTSNSPICDGGTLSLSVEASGSGALTYSWSGGGNFLPNAGVPSVTVQGAVPGDYTILVDDGCSTAGQVVSIEVNSTPQPSAGSYGPLCSGDVPLSLVGSPAGGVWSGTGVTGSSFDPSVGTQTLTYALTQGGCTGSASTTITVNSSPQPSAGSYGPLCSGDAPLTLVGSPLGGVWSGTGVTGSTFDPAAGTQTLTYALTQGGCTGSASTTITVNSSPQPSAGSYGPLCSGDAPLTLVGSPLGGVWSGTGVTGSTFDPAAGTQSLTYTLTQGGCTGSASTTITVNSTPQVSLGSYGPLCSGDAPLDLVGSPLGGVWSGTGVTGSTFDPAAGTQTLTYTLTQGGCTGSASTTITVNSTPQVSLGSYGPLCSGDAPLDLVGSPLGGVWSGTGVTGSTFDPAAGTQTLTYTLTQGGCTGSASATVAVNASPIADFALGTSELFVNEPIDFINASSSGNYAWEFGDGGISDAENPSHTYTSLGAYTVTLTVEADGCSSSFSLDVDVDMSTGIAYIARRDLRVWAGEDVIVIEHSITQPTPLQIELRDAGGRIHMHVQTAGVPDKILLPSARLSSGVWFVVLRSEHAVDVYRVPVLR